MFCAFALDWKPCCTHLSDDVACLRGFRSIREASYNNVAQFHPVCPPKAGYITPRQVSDADWAESKLIFGNATSALRRVTAEGISNSLTGVLRIVSI